MDKVNFGHVESLVNLLCTKIGHRIRIMATDDISMANKHPMLCHRIYKAALCIECPPYSIHIFPSIYLFYSIYTMIVKTFLSSAFVLALMSSMVQAQIDYDDVKTPKNAEWLKGIDMSSVPKLPIRAVGSGVCPDSTCDGDDNDECFESCGNSPAPEDIYGCPQDHHWALTFDDGPSNYTSELLDILDKEDVKATFCVMGAHVEQYPDVLKRAYESGHQIASHTFSHPHLMSLSNEEIIYEVKATEEAIEKVIGIKPHYIRPPFGEADARVKGLLKSMGYKVLLWNVDPTDYDVYMLRNVSSVIQGSFRMAAQGNDTGLNLHEDPGFISLQHGKMVYLD